MATITIRNLDEKVKRKLQVRAALNGRSMEAEAAPASQSWPKKTHLQQALKVIWESYSQLFAPLGGVELKIPPRTKSTRKIPTFD